MSDVEQFWSRACQYFHSTRKWDELNNIEQHMVVQSLNTLLALIHK